MEKRLDNRATEISAGRMAFLHSVDHTVISLNCARVIHLANIWSVVPQGALLLDINGSPATRY